MARLGLYQPFIEEFPTLIHDRASQKVLKPAGGHDDVSQAVIGAVYGCFQGEGMSFEALAIQETLEGQPGQKKEFYEEAAMEGASDDFYSGLLDSVDMEDEELKKYADSLTPDDELSRRMKQTEDPLFTYGRNPDNRRRIPKDRR